MIKRGPEHLLDIEREVLETIPDHPCLRPMIDTTEDPSSLVLRHLDDNLLNVSGQKRLEGSDLKFVARSTLEALAELHNKGFVHTGNHASLKGLKILSLTVAMAQISNLTTSSSTMVTVLPDSVKRNWGTAVMHIVSVQTQTLLSKVTQLVR